MKRRINEDVTITDPTLASQYLAVKKQMSDKKQKRDQLMRSVSQVDSELNILERNLIAIETKANQSQVKSSEIKPAENIQQTPTATAVAKNESLNETLYDHESFLEEVISFINDEYHDGESLAYDYDTLIRRNIKQGKTPKEVAATIIDLERSFGKNPDFDPHKKFKEDESYIGGDTFNNIAMNAATPPLVNESVCEDLVSDLQKEISKLTDIKSYIENWDNKEEQPEDNELTREPLAKKETNNDSEKQFNGDYDFKKRNKGFMMPGIYDTKITPPEEFERDILFDEEDKDDPFETTEEERTIDETLKAGDKEPFVPPLVENEDVDNELEMMNYEDEDEPKDEYVFHVKVDPETDEEIIAKVYKDNPDKNWRVRVVKGDEEPLQSTEFDFRLNKLDIIGYLADIYSEVEIIDPKEYEYLLNDKEDVDDEYYESEVG